MGGIPGSVRPASGLERAEAKLLQDSGGSVQPVHWAGLVDEPRAKLQSFWYSKLQETRKEALLQGLSHDDQVDLRSAGGPGAGGFLENPVEFDGDLPQAMPAKHH